MAEMHAIHEFFPAEKYFLDPLRCQIGAILPFLFEAKTFTLESGNPFVTAIIAAAGIQQCRFFKQVLEF